MEPPRWTSDASDATSSASEGLSESSPRIPAKRSATRGSATPAPKRKATYYQRKDEIEALEKQIETLEGKLREAQQTSLVVANEALTRMDPVTLRKVHDEAIERNNLKLAGTQAMLSSYNQKLGSMNSMVPLTTYIHMPVDPAARERVLLSWYEPKLKSTLAFMNERTRGIDLTTSQTQKEQFDFPNGDMAATGFAITQFDTGHSLRQVYDAFMFFVYHQEISLSEELGVLTIRDDDLDGKTCCQSRFLSTLPEGIEIEYNAAMFAKCVERTIDAPGYAVGMIDFINEDDLHPKRPELCASKEFTGAMMLTEIPSVVSPDGPPMIAQTWWYYVHLRAPLVPMSERVRQAARNSIARWHEVAGKVMKDRLAMVPPNAL